MPDVLVSSTIEDDRRRVLDRRKGGRPKKRKTSVVSVRLPDHIYDAYCKTALRADMDVRSILRHVLTIYVPKG